MKRLGISQVDALFSNGCYPIEFLFCYSQALDTDRIRRALRRLSSPFWPLFGEYRDGTIVFEGYREEDFLEEEAVGRELDIPEMEEDYSGTCSCFRLPDLRKLFFMKVIRFRNGTVLVPKMNHLAGDGYSYFLFLTALAALSRPVLFSLKPYLMRSFIRPRHRRTVLKGFSFRGVQLEPPRHDGMFVLEREAIPRGDVHSIIRDAASSGATRISANDVLSALALKRLTARNPKGWGTGIDLTIPIDVRRRIGEYGRLFFGNGIMLHTLPLNKLDIERARVQDVAVEIRKSMPEVSKETYVDYLSGLEKLLSEGRWDKFKPFDPASGTLVTNLSRLPVDRLDFGAGRPELILPLTVERNSAGILAGGDNYILRFVF